jgi:hypothetical protein
MRRRVLPSGCHSTGPTRVKRTGCRRLPGIQTAKLWSICPSCGSQRMADSLLPDCRATAFASNERRRLSMARTHTRSVLTGRASHPRGSDREPGRGNLGWGRSLNSNHARRNPAAALQRARFKAFHNLFRFPPISLKCLEFYPGRSVRFAPRAHVNSIFTG